ncbi:RNA-binding S4 domain-containing protein [Psychrobium sp. 1_MG-2023]|uniref:RNA-binding S4 domain-containing protein n=1 Tax=Psychrobium sp. 1_MG-2023 TaxID=3062624 RepID=UPI000C342DB7|nr:RNA-binding S4 domain-containing protein [Psychrobium sp. 1_MG-2023]MDP2561847.1 RNA-binding S4 domain-containing protein [Psychrobium sp. 1_MG-2023]PKF55782.1 RNA-binding protein [Alteromonadales bacterium alter-6D02]
MVIGRRKKPKAVVLEPLETIVEVNVEPIELYKVLKIENLVEGGGEAKIRISQGEVMLNGLIETRKRKKVYHGDVVEYQGQLLKVSVDGKEDEES